MRVWSGIICASRDLLPLVGQVPEKEGLYVAVGFHGKSPFSSSRFQADEKAMAWLESHKSPVVSLKSSQRVDGMIDYQGVLRLQKSDWKKPKRLRRSSPSRKRVVPGHRSLQNKQKSLTLCLCGPVGNGRLSERLEEPICRDESCIMPMYRGW